MNTLRLPIAAILLFFTATFSFAQPEYPGNLQFKLELMKDGKTWGVYVKPDHTISPSNKTRTGSGQVTIVAPVDFTYSSLKNFGGAWIENARVNAPVEASDKAYVSFGFVVEEPKINLFPNEETLLFSFTTSKEFVGKINLIDNNNDPFLPPNSYQSNPGNDLGVIDFGSGEIVYYTYGANYGEENNSRSAIAGEDTSTKVVKENPTHQKYAETLSAEVKVSAH
jgi:hypothetical protein